MNIIELIKSNINSLSKSDQKIGKYIISNPEVIEMYTILKLSELTNTSTSAVLRFCKKLGFKGYSEFRYEIIRYLHKESINSKAENNDPVVQIIDYYKNSINNFINIDRQIFTKLVELIDDASQIFSFGIYKSSLVAHKLKYNLIDCGKAVTLISDSVTLNHSEFIIDNDSLLIIFSVSGSNFETENFLKNNQDKSFRTCLITCNKNAKLKKYTEHEIIIPTVSSPLYEHFDEHALMIVFVEILTLYYTNNKNAY